jgi:xanthine dehydrogenase YagS FAD-binding subunit
MRSFEMYEPKTTAEAVALLAESHGAPDGDQPRLYAGGQDLLTEMKEDLARPAALVNLKHIPGLGTIEVGRGGVLRIGALTRLSVIERSALLAELFPALVQAAASVASPQIRSRATLGGNLCQRPHCIYYRNAAAICLKKGGNECLSEGGVNRHNAILGGGPSWIVHPSDLAPALIALDATVHLASPQGEREMPLAEFFMLPSEGDPTRENRLEPQEMVTAVTLPPGSAAGATPGGGETRQVFLKFGERESFDFALAAVALRLRLAGGRIREARLVLGGVAPTPWRCSKAERLLIDVPMERRSWQAAADAALADAEPLEQNGYKVPLTHTLILRAFATLAGEEGR